MGEWVDHPHAETALSNILPCVDQRTTNQTLIESKEVTKAIVDIVNEFVDHFANSNPPPQAYPIYYNQSGPLMPYLCHPYDSHLLDLQCPPQEVSMGNASQVCCLLYIVEKIAYNFFNGKEVSIGTHS